MTSGERRIRGSVHEKTRGKGMHSPANCPAVVPERESSFFHNLCPEPSEKICSFQETRTSLEMHFFHPLFS